MYHCPTCGVDHEGHDLQGVPKQFCNKTHWIRFNNLKSRYKLTPKDVARMYLKQKGRCKICKEVGSTQEIGNPKLRNLKIDHCHKTGKVRGLLCNSCNLALGHFKDDKSSLLKAILYLGSRVPSSIYLKLTRIYMVLYPFLT